MPTYGDKELEFTRGRGCYLFTKTNYKYLDFAIGIAENVLSGKVEQNCKSCIPPIDPPAGS